MLKDAPLHMDTLARTTGEYHAMMLFNSFVGYLMGISEHGITFSHNTHLTPSNLNHVSLLLRVLTPTLKGSVCKRSIHALQECMEALGGVGYLDNTENEAINISRLYRDCCVLSIWEGTTDVLATDMLRVIKGRSGADVLDAVGQWILKALGSTTLHPLQSEKSLLLTSWQKLQEKFVTTSANELLPRARQLLFELSDITMGVLLIADAEIDGNEAAMAVCSRFLQNHLDMSTFASSQAHQSLALNQRIVYGEDADLSPTHYTPSRL